MHANEVADGRSRGSGSRRTRANSGDNAVIRDAVIGSVWRTPTWKRYIGTATPTTAITAAGRKVAARPGAPSLSVRIQLTAIISRNLVASTDRGPQPSSLSRFDSSTLPTEPTPQTSVSARPSTSSPAGCSQTPLWPLIEPHTSTLSRTQMPSDASSSPRSVELPRRSSGPSSTVAAGPMASPITFTTAGSRYLRA
ncbi:hypothetical protein QMK34_12060 [Amycolatopsis sp. H20-H5]|nr:hypothetical protein [Amycolatopsis sp. H20-H5]MEC3976011.1 hypothetical protein [Amycolatopsis sp. H20-H5]